MTSKLDGFSFRTIRPSPTNPHNPAKFITPENIHKSGSVSGSLSSDDDDRINRRKFQHLPQSSPYNPHLDDNKMQMSNGVISHKEITLEETPGPSSRYTPLGNRRKLDENQQNKQKENTKLWLGKVIIGIVVIVIAIIGSVYFILYYTHPRVNDPTTNKQIQPSTKPPDAGTGCSKINKEVGFKDVLTLNCKVHLQSSRLTNLSIYYTPFYGSYKPKSTVYFDLTESQISDNGWNISVYNNTDSSGGIVDIIILREPAKCDSGGDYILQFNASEQIMLTHTETVKIESKVSDVRLEVLQNNKTDETGTFYEITCTAQSECRLAPISLLGVFGDENTQVEMFGYGVNFSCLINYNDEEGWRVKCTGKVPNNIYSSLNSIACRPFTGNKTQDVDTEISYKICRDCTFKCEPDEPDRYYVDPVICNIFHRCNFGAHYIQPCGKETYFNTQTCACDHKENNPDVCNDKNERVIRKSKIVKCGE